MLARPFAHLSTCTLQWLAVHVNNQVLYVHIIYEHISISRTQGPIIGVIFLQDYAVWHPQILGIVRFGAVTYFGDIFKGRGQHFLFFVFLEKKWQPKQKIVRGEMVIYRIPLDLTVNLYL